MRNFTPSNSNKRGPRLAQKKAGFFCLLSEGEFAPTYRRPVYSTERLRSVSPAQVDCLTAVVSGPLFCPLFVKQSHHVSRNSNAVRPAKAGPNSAGNKPAAAGYIHPRRLAEAPVPVQLSYLFSVP